jgi:hypothetical protein
MLRLSQKVGENRLRIGYFGNAGCPSCWHRPAPSLLRASTETDSSGDRGLGANAEVILLAK